MTYRDVISNTAKEFLKNENIELEDWQKAWIIYHSDYGITEKQDGLITIAKETKDELLRAQIGFVVGEEKERIAVITETDENAVYLLEEYYEKDDPVVRGCYDSFELASKMAEGLGSRYAISKMKLTKEDRGALLSDAHDAVIGSMVFSENGNLESIYGGYSAISSWEDEHDSVLFHERYYSFVHPFRLGDIVRCIGKNETCLRIVTGIGNRRDLSILDDTDSGIYVASLDVETGKIWNSDTPENPYLFDHHDIDPNTRDIPEQIILEWQGLLRGEGGSMQFIQDGCLYLREKYEEVHKIKLITGFELRTSWI